MFSSVLTKNLNWESLTKNLVNFNFIMGFTEKSDFFREGWAVFRIKGEGGWKKKRGCSVSLILEDGACYDEITKSVDSQTNIIFFSK